MSIREDVHRVCDAVQAVHNNDITTLDTALAGMPAGDYVRASQTVLEVAINAVAVGLREDFDVALHEVRTQIVGRLPDGIS